MDLTINSSATKPLRRIKLPISNTNTLKPRGMRTDILDLEELYDQEKESAPVRLYGTVTYQSPLTNITDAISDKSDFFRKSLTPFDHLGTFKPHLAKLVGFDLVTRGYQEVVQIISTPDSLDFVDPTQFCANIYGATPVNFVVCDSESSGVADYVFVVYSTSLLRKGANIYGSIYSGPSFGFSLVSQYESSYSVSVGSETAFFGFRPIDRFEIVKEDLPFNNGYVYAYLNSLLTIYPKEGYAKDCLYQSYKLVELAKIDYNPKKQLDDNC